MREPSERVERGQRTPRERSRRLPTLPCPAGSASAGPHGRGREAGPSLPCASARHPKALDRCESRRGHSPSSHR